jgi:hypothetical protein
MARLTPPVPNWPPTPATPTKTRNQLVTSMLLTTIIESDYRLVKPNPQANLWLS